jgi:hypothetical protein
MSKQLHLITSNYSCKPMSTAETRKYLPMTSCSSLTTLNVFFRVHEMVESWKQKFRNLKRS